MHILRAPLRFLVKTVILHPLSTIALVALLGVVFFFASSRVPAPLATEAGSAQGRPDVSSEQVMAKGTLPAAPATEAFMQGQATFNADLVWEALSDQIHQTLSAQGAGKQEIQTQLDQSKQAGQGITDFTYVGGYSPGGAETFYFYVASVHQGGIGGQTNHVFFAFTVGQDGKINRVE